MLTGREARRFAHLLVQLGCQRTEVADLRRFGVLVGRLQSLCCTARHWSMFTLFGVVREVSRPVSKSWPAAFVIY